MDHPALFRARLAVRRAFTGLLGVEQAEFPLALVGLSGGADSLALAAAMSGEARQLGIRVGAVIVDHGLQEGSAEIARRAALVARSLGLDPIVTHRVEVSGAGDGPEAAARRARYEAFAEVAAATGARWIATAHTRDDQAEQVLLALARGSGLRSLSGIPIMRELGDGITLVRPFLGGDPEITRADTLATCAEAGLSPWHDPQNEDPAYTRVRVRHTLLPVVAQELGSGVAANLARTADLAREDADALDAWALTVVHEIVDPAPDGDDDERRIPAAYFTMLRALPAAVRQRVIHRIASELGASLHREHVLSAAALITHWRGQGPAFVPGLSIERSREALVFRVQHGSPRDSGDRA